MTTTEILASRHAEFPHIALWIAQAQLAVVFGFTGALKTFLPAAVLFEKLPIAAFALPFIRLLGIAELAAAAGLILPALDAAHGDWNRRCDGGAFGLHSAPASSRRCRS